MLAPSLQTKCLGVLRKICGSQALIPRSAQIPLLCDRSTTPLYQGGCADVWECRHQGSYVAVKVLRVSSTSNLGKVAGVSPHHLFVDVYVPTDVFFGLEVLQGGCELEGSSPSERATLVGCDNG